MTPDELEQLLGAVAAAADGPAVLSLANELQAKCAQCHSLDAEDRRRIVHALESRQLESRISATPAPFGIGETVLLLHAATLGHALAPRLGTVATAARQRFTAESRAEIDRARRGLMHAVACACRTLPQAALASEFDVWLAGNVDIEGGSLGLSVCVALVSRGLELPPAQAVAGSAAVTPDGLLAPVQYLSQKSAALRTRWPGITKLVVAADQVVTDDLGIEIVRCRDVAEALGVFGLDVGRLKAAQLDDHVHRVERFKRDNARTHSASEWRRLGWEALESAEALGCAGGDRRMALEGKAWGALFFLHAGDSQTAISLVRSISAAEAAEIGGELAAFKSVIEATGTIDVATAAGEPERAVPVAFQALELARGVNSTDLLGQALGTYGRALLHAGRADEAEGPLRQAIAHHALVAPREVPRSRTYLATCLRHQGRVDGALAEVDDAVAEAGRFAAWDISRSTLVFLDLEKGRGLLARGDAAGAMPCFERVSAAYPSDVDYPRPAALRGLAMARRLLGDGNEADSLLRRCVEVAHSAEDQVIRMVAVIAVGEHLMDPQLASSIPRRELEDVWRSVYPDATTSPAIRQLIDRWVY